ncbi:hypothetical protein B5M43_013205 [Microbacterium sp. MEC084]|uniref:Uncharacterized protein n=1 Tax=Microbacterium paludicola TaxID=300019 RepID=A0A4Y9FTV2_9MICO|nr:MULTISPECIES: DUF6804 family protein [Microbacterium]MBF0816638.1 hypothetical protein [Microbacterium paludicola]MCD1269783.1 hypothetical protein [Microbacterium sp. MEC084]TFU32720.1 hypothetical protein E4U02_09450 [Microbacterium paludicola]
MNQRPRTPSQYQRNALAPSLIAAPTLFLAPLLLGGEWATIVLFIVAIFAMITAWFAFQARQWWWIIVFAAIAVLWNPAYPFPFEGPLWTAAQPVAAVTFLTAGALIKIPRPS